MEDEQLLRYSRQIMLPEFDIEGQQRLLNARVLLVGVGGLGSPVALYLAAAGVGRLVLADFDRVDLSNLQRQIAHGTQDIGRLKVESAAEAIRSINPDVGIETLAERLDEAKLERHLADVDLVIDGCDNFQTRHAVNAACVASGTPLVSGAVIRMEGQLAVFRADRPGQPCYHCLFPASEDVAETCSETGILSPLPGIIGSLQALEAIKILSGCGTPSDSKLLVFDATQSSWRSLRIPKDPNCPVCARH
ncbi:molybdopterin-synthase adenylyltransferase MoeB [Alkalilimnicola ehrlichii]|uniref:Molybdopterin-synthase adenylyltransferase n=1 Tax=Alkalilimnicola ehrlichii TaxID=351052 RepID=A0A3E0X327_9GAMM|nr:molybdopterin-synthase adenylyltransferase MoeB [Alkalilimnicola ehrlichii]RFA39438.1 molybdopterin-synthase adenylyltransferase MoeB [Alkalilimnicola ehrlichii]